MRERDLLLDDITSMNSGRTLPVSSFFFMAMLLAVCSKPVRVISGAAILIAPLDPTYLLFFPRVRLCFGMIGLRPCCSASVCSVTW